MSNKAGNGKFPSSIVIPILESAIAIEDALSPYFKPYQLGFYSKRSSSPILKSGETYVIKHVQGMTEFVLSPTGLPEIASQDNSFILDKSGNVIAPTSLLTTLSSKPQIPINGLNIVRDYIEFLLSRQCKWLVNKKPFYAYLEKYFQDEVTSSRVFVERTNPNLDSVWDEILKQFVSKPDLFSTSPNPVFVECEETILLILNNIYCFVDEFISPDGGWGMYESRHNLFSSIIVRRGDYRIEDWMSKYGSEFK